MIFRAARGVEVTQETLAIETILNIGPGGNFLGDPHTRNFMRKEYFQPKLVYQAGTAAQKLMDQRSVLDAARDSAEGILKSHHPIQLPEETIQEIQRIVDSATRNLTRT
jgi:trimethylamine--corrinoid protein Co-methyltransferase